MILFLCSFCWFLVIIRWKDIVHWFVLQMIEWILFLLRTQTNLLQRCFWYLTSVTLKTIETFLICIKIIDINDCLYNFSRWTKLIKIIFINLVHAWLHHVNAVLPREWQLTISTLHCWFLDILIRFFRFCICIFVWSSRWLYIWEIIKFCMLIWNNVFIKSVYLITKCGTTLAVVLISEFAIDIF